MRQASEPCLRTIHRLHQRSTTQCGPPTSDIKLLGCTTAYTPGVSNAACSDSPPPLCLHHQVPLPVLSVKLQRAVCLLPLCNLAAALLIERSPPPQQQTPSLLCPAGEADHKGGEGVTLLLQMRHNEQNEWFRTLFAWDGRTVSWDLMAIYSCIVSCQASRPCAVKFSIAVLRKNAVHLLLARAAALVCCKKLLL